MIENKELTSSINKFKRLITRSTKKANLLIKLNTEIEKSPNDYSIKIKRKLEEDIQALNDAIYIADEDCKYLLGEMRA